MLSLVNRLFAKMAKFLFSGDAGSVFRGMLTLASGAILARLIAMVATPALTRLYEPDEFGALATFASIVSFVAPILTLRYSLAIPLPKSDAVAKSLVKLCVFLICASTFLLIFLSLRFGSYWLVSLDMAYLIPYKTIIVLGVVGTALFEMLSMCAVRNLQYSVISKADVIQAACGTTIQIVTGLFAASSIGLLLGQGTKQSIGAVLLAFRYFPTFRTTTDSNSIFISAREFYGFPLYRLPSQVLLVFSHQAPLIFFAINFGPSMTGQLSIAFLVIAIPMSILGQSMSNSYFAEIAKTGANNPKLLATITRLVVTKLILLGLPPAVILFIFGPELFIFVFGEEWSIAGKFSSILSLFLVCQFATSPVINLFSVVNRQFVYLILNILRSLGVLIIFLILPVVMRLTPTQVMAVYSIFMALFYVAIYILVQFTLARLSVTSQPFYGEINSEDS